MELKKIKIEELKPAGYNPRKELKPTDKEYQKIKNSLEEFGYVDPVIVNKDMTIIGGHQRTNVMKDLGYNEVECIVIDIDKTKEKALNIALNKITGEWDFNKLNELIIDLDKEGYDLTLTGFDDFEIKDILEPIIDTTTEEGENPYTTKINIPQYEIKGDNPDISELFDYTKTRALLKEIEEADITEEQKNFLSKAATRHIAFNYSKVAEYYAHQDKTMQELMEKSALVIIDFDDAIMNGYAEISKDIEDMKEEGLSFESEE